MGKTPKLGESISSSMPPRVGGTKFEADSGSLFRKACRFGRKVYAGNKNRWIGGLVATSSAKYLGLICGTIPGLVVTSAVSALISMIPWNINKHYVLPLAITGAGLAFAPLVTTEILGLLGISLSIWGAIQIALGFSGAVVLVEALIARLTSGENAPKAP